MIDAITYSSDVGALTERGRMVRIERGGLEYRGDKTPTVRNGIETLAVVRVDDLQTVLDSGLEVLASAPAGGFNVYDELFADPAARAIYNRVHRQAGVPYTDDDGASHTFTPSAYIGVFA